MSDGSSEENKKKKTFGSLMSSFADTTSLQGPAFIKRGGVWYSKTIWVFIFIIAMTAATVHVYYVCISNVALITKMDGFDRKYQLPRNYRNSLGSTDALFRSPGSQWGLPPDIGNRYHSDPLGKDILKKTSDGSSEENKKKKTFGSLMSSFADTTSLQGPAFIKRGGVWYSKTIWVFIFIIAMTAATVHVYYVCAHFYSYETTTKISLGYRNLPFPSISICNINPVRLSQVPHASQTFQHYLQKLSPPTQVDPKYRKGEGDTGNSTTHNPGDGDGGQTGDHDSDTNHTTSGNDDQAGEQGPDAPGTNQTAPDDGSEGGGSSPDGSRKRRMVKRSNFTSRPIHAGSGSDGESRDGNYGANEYDYSEYDDYEDQMDFGFNSKVDPTAQQMADFRYLLSSEPYDTRLQLGHQKDVFILKCVYNGRECSAANFSILPPSSTLGNCYSFNSVDYRNSAMFTRRSGSDFGLDLILYLERHEYVAGLSGGAGARLHIHPFDTLPFVVENGMSAPPGAETQIGLRLLNITRLGGDYGECHNDTVFRKLYNRKYTIDGCLHTCTHQTIALVCRCYMAEQKELYPKEYIKNLNPCDYSNKTVSKCVLQQERSYMRGSSRCNKECSQPCKEINYAESVSSHQWPDSGLYSKMVDKVCAVDGLGCQKLQEEENKKEALRENFLRIKIYYNDLNFETIEQVPEYEFTQFLSDVGGSVGLWVGASFVTVLELFDLIVQILTFLGIKSRDNNVQKPKKRPESTYRKQEHPLNHSANHMQTETGSQRF